MNIIPQKREKKSPKCSIFVLFFNNFVVNIGCFIRIAFLLVKLIRDEDSGHFITMVFQESQSC